jgi:hypothetical protein
VLTDRLAQGLIEDTLGRVDSYALALNGEVHSFDTEFIQEPVAVIKKSPKKNGYVCVRRLRPQCGHKGKTPGIAKTVRPGNAGRKGMRRR